jgi:hypothetical protein
VLAAPRGRLWAFVAAIVGIGAALRILAATGDLWFDEVWSWWIARGLLKTWLIDNNHPLNTLWIALVPDRSPAWAFRLLSIVTGSLTIALGAKFSRRWGAAHAIFTAALLCAAFPLVLYQSEARGYAAMLFALLASIEVTLLILDEQLPRGPLVLLVCVVLGVASHPAFIVGYIAILLITISIVWQRSHSATTIANTLARLHLAPIVVMAIAYFGFYLQMDFGGGPAQSASAALRAAVSQLSTLSPTNLTLIAACIALAIVSTLAHLRGATAIAALAIVTPVLAALTAHLQSGSLLYVRYFLPSMLMSLLVAGWMLGELAANLAAQQNLFTKTIVPAIILAWLCGQAIPLSRLITLGRAHHSEALAFIVSHSGPGPISVSSDQPTRTKVLVEFYRRRIEGGTRIHFLPDDAPMDQAEWIIRGPRDHNESSFTSPGGFHYTLRNIFGTYRQDINGSGSTWQVYQRDPDVLANLK